MNLRNNIINNREETETFVLSFIQNQIAIYLGSIPKKPGPHPIFGSPHSPLQMVSEKLDLLACKKVAGLE